MPKLPTALHEEITRLCDKAGEHAEAFENAQALVLLWKAWDLIPQPKQEWEAAIWVLGAIGDLNFHSRDFKAGRDNLSAAMHCAGGLGNPFLHLRLGQCQFELGNLPRAADELIRAYMGAGPDIFEDEDPKFFSFLQTQCDGLEAPTA